MNATSSSAPSRPRSPRRTRAQARIERLKDLRAKRAARRESLGSVNMEIASGALSGKLVSELTHVSKHFGTRCIVRDFSATILRGDKVGLLGPNGAGKTTLLKLILGELQPDPAPAGAPAPEPGHSPWGTVRLGTNVSVAYFDQMRNARVDDAKLHRGKISGQPGDSTGNHETHELVSKRMESERMHAVLVDTNADDDLPEW